MFESGFSEGISADRKLTENSITETISPLMESKSNSSTNAEKHVIIEDDYDLFYAILYYIYTNQIIFSTDLTMGPVGLGRRLCDAEDIYAIADRMFLNDLRLKALDFLSRTCTVENITGRLFGNFADLHKDVKETYAVYFQGNFRNIKESIEHQRFFEKLEAEGDWDEIVRVFNQYRKVMSEAKVGNRQTILVSNAGSFFIDAFHIPNVCSNCFGCLEYSNDARSNTESFGHVVSGVVHIQDLAIAAMPSTARDTSR